jgi:signal transduction histidine kinase
MPLASDQDIELVFEPKMEHASVCTDPHALKRVLGNLTGNALKYTPAGGRVLIGLSMDEQNLVCSVEDTGPGISEEDLPHIFEQHFRTESAVSAHVPGSGIGLALVHELVELMSGTVRAESPVDDGRGTRFVVNFALAGQVNDEKA